MTSPFDFLDAIDRRFQSSDDFISYVEESVDLDDLSDGLNIVGAINDHAKRSPFINSLESHFDVLDSSGDLYLLRADTGEGYVPYYVYFDEKFPVFFTTANITNEMPPTINQYLRNTHKVGRFWLSKRQMEDLRKDIVSEFEDILIPFFSAKRTPGSEIPSQKRPNVDRSITYYADDGLETYREMRYQYGVLPRILEFERPNHFKFRVKNRGVFVHERGSVSEMWKILKKEQQRKEEIKSIIDTGELEQSQSSIFEEQTISVSRPWGIKAKDGIKPNAVRNFENHLQETSLEFGISEFDPSPEIPGFEAELIDNTSFETTRLMSSGDTVRVYPRELTDVDQSFRIYNFVSDHFGPKCEAVRVK